MGGTHALQGTGRAACPVPGVSLPASACPGTPATAASAPVRAGWPVWRGDAGCPAPSDRVLPCVDVNECTLNLCHPAAICYNTPGSFSCQCQPGYEGDGFQCTHGKAAVRIPVPQHGVPILTAGALDLPAAQSSTQRLTPCEHEQLYPRTPGHVPQCDEQGGYRPLQCHSGSGHCWCVDSSGQEIAGTRTAAGSTPPRCGNPGGCSLAVLNVGR